MAFSGNQVAKPIVRSKSRRWLGKQYYIARRKLAWWLQPKKFSKAHPLLLLPHSLISHQSLLLRPLKDVDMVLQHNKITNLQLALQHINRVLIRPGETFSFWKLVGSTSKRKGYKMGLVLRDGKIDRGIGGGLCQLGNLIYWMALHSPLHIAERYRHGYDVFPDVNRKIPFGCGATLSYNYIDLQLHNPTDEAYQLIFRLSDTHLHGEIRANAPLSHRYTVYESQHLIRGEAWGGYTRHNQIRRKITDFNSGKLIADELMVENHAIMMYNPLLQSGTIYSSVDRPVAADADSSS